jgi:hypothetical protein
MILAKKKKNTKKKNDTTVVKPKWCHKYYFFNQINSGTWPLPLFSILSKHFFKKGKKIVEANMIPRISGWNDTMIHFLKSLCHNDSKTLSSTIKFR